MTGAEGKCDSLNAKAEKEAKIKCESCFIFVFDSLTDPSTMVLYVPTKRKHLTSMLRCSMLMFALSWKQTCAVAVVQMQRSRTQEQ